MKHRDADKITIKGYFSMLELIFFLHIYNVLNNSVIKTTYVHNKKSFTEVYSEPC